MRLPDFDRSDLVLILILVFFVLIMAEFIGLLISQ